MEYTLKANSRVFLKEQPKNPHNCHNNNNNNNTTYMGEQHGPRQKLLATSYCPSLYCKKKNAQLKDQLSLLLWSKAAYYKEYEWQWFSLFDRLQLLHCQMTRRGNVTTDSVPNY